MRPGIEEARIRHHPIAICGHIVLGQLQARHRKKSRLRVL